MSDRAGECLILKLGQPDAHGPGIVSQPRRPRQSRPLRAGDPHAGGQCPRHRLDQSCRRLARISELAPPLHPWPRGAAPHGAAAGLAGAIVRAQAVALAAGAGHRAGRRGFAPGARLHQRLRHPAAAAVFGRLVSGEHDQRGGFVDLGRLPDRACGALPGAARGFGNRRTQIRNARPRMGLAGARVSHALRRRAHRAAGAGTRHHRSPAL